jgi:PKD repeat protein
MKSAFTYLFLLAVLLSSCSSKDEPQPQPQTQSEPAPIADFTWTANKGVVAFSNKSKNALSYSWDFGNGTTSTNPNPTVSYDKNATYKVTLVAKSKSAENNKSSSIAVSDIPLTLKDVVDNQGLVDFLPGVWGVYVQGQDRKFNNYIYQFSSSTDIMGYKNYHNDYFTLLDPQLTTINYKFSIEKNIIYTEIISGKKEKYARVEVVSLDEMKLYRIIETASTYSELPAVLLTRTSNVEKPLAGVVNSNTISPILTGVWDQGAYSIYTDVSFDFSAGKNYYNYNTTFQGAKSITKNEFKVSDINILSYRQWNSDFDPSWKKYKIEVVSDTQIKLYPISPAGTVSKTVEYTLKKR